MPQYILAKYICCDRGLVLCTSALEGFSEYFDWKLLSQLGRLQVACFSSKLPSQQQLQGPSWCVGETQVSALGACTPKPNAVKCLYCHILARSLC
jgi:hypothetical protein